MGMGRPARRAFTSGVMSGAQLRRSGWGCSEPVCVGPALNRDGRLTPHRSPRLLSDLGAKLAPPRQVNEIGGAQIRNTREKRARNRRYTGDLYPW